MVEVCKVERQPVGSKRFASPRLARVVGESGVPLKWRVSAQLRVALLWSPSVTYGVV